MLAPPTPPAPTPPTDPRARIERQLAVLDRLAEAGLNIALAVERQATSAPDAAAGPSDPALAYARVSRAVRMTVALQARLLQDLQALERGGFEARHARRRQVERIVGRVIEAEHEGDEDEAERLADEASERLEHDDFYGDIASRPVSEIVAEVCRDLGLSPDWANLAGEAWARGEIEAGSACAPLKRLSKPPAVVAQLRRPAPQAASP